MLWCGWHLATEKCWLEEGAWQYVGDSWAESASWCSLPAVLLHSDWKTTAPTIWALPFFPQPMHATWASTQMPTSAGKKHKSCFCLQQSLFPDWLGSLGNYKGIKIYARFIGNSSIIVWEKALGTHTKNVLKVFFQEELSEFQSIYSTWVCCMLGPKGRLSFKLKNRTKFKDDDWF